MALHHTRSHSFPSASHPATIQVDENLSSEATPSSLSSMTDRLNGLKNLYESVDDLLLQSHIQRIISQECREKWVDEILDEYISLLDACATAKDLFSCAKKDVQKLLSALRRRKDAEDFHGYLTSRRNFRKMVQKSLKISSTRNKQKFQVLEKECETRPVVHMLMEAESATLALLESLLSYVIGTKVQTRQSGWSLVSKLMHSKKVSSQGEQTESNEFNKVDTALLSFMGSKTNKEDDIKVDDLLNHLQKMESSIQILEEGLECLFRRLIKTRVLLLNILSH
ncbi:hypothetical protein Pfo_004563 [Paulownia fortunei]|nr:hypothetical protein Pfo_004563 [Paulownia fortunei]